MLNVKVKLNLNAKSSHTIWHPNTEISKSQLHEASVGAQIKTKVANSYTYISNLCKSIFSDIL